MVDGSEAAGIAPEARYSPIQCTRAHLAECGDPGQAAGRRGGVHQRQSRFLGRWWFAADAWWAGCGRQWRGRMGIDAQGQIGAVMGEPSAPDVGRHSTVAVGKPDFPYYNGVPVWIGGWGWSLVMGASAVGFVLLSGPIRWGLVTQDIPAVLLFVLPLGALALVAPSGWRSLFRRVGWREVWLILEVTALYLLAIVISGVTVGRVLRGDDNPDAIHLRHGSWAFRIADVVESFPQLFGEEFLAIVPLLAVMSLCYRKFGWSRRAALIVAWLVSSLIFGVLHLYTYDWNVLQCLLFIGGGRVIITLGYIRSKNIWVCTTVHILSDLALFGPAYFGH